MPTFTYLFDELPLVVADGIEAAPITGSAEIEYSRRDCQDWRIVSVAVEGYRSITWAQRQAGMNPWVYIPASDEIDRIIRLRLQERSSRIDSAVSDRIDEDRECAADEYADMKKET